MQHAKKQSTPVGDLTPSPTKISDHAIQRFRERWLLGHKNYQPDQWRGDYLSSFLHINVARAIRVENIPNEKQSIWRWIGTHLGDIVEVLFVVNADGYVTTFLPPGARKPANRKRSRR